MVTVLQCVKDLGIAHSPMVLSIIGNVVKWRMSRFIYNIPKQWQDENGEWIYVNAYPDERKDQVKAIILEYVTGKRREDVLIESRYYKREQSHYAFGRYIDTNLKRYDRTRQ